MNDNKLEEHPLTNPFWQFSLKVYQSEPVKKQCLSLQNNTCANVNLLLFCCWLSGSLAPIPHSEFILVCDSINDWHTKVTLPLRQVRQYLKESQTNPWVKSFYQHLLTQEIHSEAYQQQMLYAHFKQKKLLHSFHSNKELALRYLTWLFEHMGIIIDKNLDLQLRKLVDLALTFVV
ncbi:TIGR02444 family protein [Legionella brunensis]|uniref:TIGR02444 family protein n=1 Tax=Legionella brunensis TaxID=29422 RepID=A0A0W0S2U8_9GAMM|nr:TIGR02444 family protein [Legionella brunensis]KTC77847.1 hypothetical protein Lbru_2740 [Legionella brunensis]